MAVGFTADDQLGAFDVELIKGQPGQGLGDKVATMRGSRSISRASLLSKLMSCASKVGIKLSERAASTPILTDTPSMLEANCSSAGRSMSIRGTINPCNPPHTPSTNTQTLTQTMSSHRVHNDHVRSQPEGFGVMSGVSVIVSMVSAA